MVCSTWAGGQRSGYTSDDRRCFLRWRTGRAGSAGCLLYSSDRLKPSASRVCSMSWKWLTWCNRPVACRAPELPGWAFYLLPDSFRNWWRILRFHPTTRRSSGRRNRRRAAAVRCALVMAHTRGLISAFAQEEACRLTCWKE